MSVEGNRYFQKESNIVFPETSQSTIIRSAFRSRADIVLVGEFYTQASDEWDGHESFQLIGAPQIPTFDATALSDLLNIAAPFRTDPSLSKGYFVNTDTRFMLGKNAYTETLAQFNRTTSQSVTVFEEGSNQRLRFSLEPWETTQTIPVNRITVTMLYPDVESASYAVAYKAHIAKAQKKGILLADGLLEQLLVEIDVRSLNELKEQVRDVGGIDTYIEQLLSGDRLPNPASPREYDSIERRSIHIPSGSLGTLTRL